MMFCRGLKPPPAQWRLMRGVLLNSGGGVAVALAGLSVYLLIGPDSGVLGTAIEMLIAVVLAVAALGVLLVAAGYVAWLLGAGQKTERQASELVRRFNAEQERRGDSARDDR